MNKSKERALEYENSLDYYHYTSDNPSVAYEAGYKQAEQDLALTWEDVAFICQTCTKIINSLPDKPCAYTPGFKDLYGEVLKRFNEHRKK